MYSYEIDNYLKERNYYLNSNEVLLITNIELNPQISRITYNPEYNFYEMYTYDGYYFKFGVKPYVRSLRKD